jgi:hypothetical protein
MKKSIIKSSITVKNKKFYYYITKYHDEGAFIECREANIAQEFLNEDIPRIIFQLPQLILDNFQNQEKQDYVVRFRVTKEEKGAIEKKALDNGFKTVSAFLKDLVKKA